MQKQVQPEDFADPLLRGIAERIWQQQQDEGQIVLNEFLSLLEQAEQKSAALQWVEEASIGIAEDVLAGASGHLAEERRRQSERKGMAQLRRGESEVATAAAEGGRQTTSPRCAAYRNTCVRRTSVGRWRREDDIFGPRRPLKGLHGPMNLTTK